MKAYVDQDVCIGCGMCTGIAPDSFQMNDEGKAEFIGGDVDGDKAEAVKEAIDSCPVQAISEE